MILHKILHVKQAVPDAKAAIFDVRPYRARLEDIHRITRLGNGETAWTISLPGGMTADLRITQIKSNDPHVVAFRSIEGDIEVMGMIEFVSIRERLTQVEITVDYRIHSFFGRWADRLMNVVDKFANKQLSVVRNHIEGVDAALAGQKARFGRTRRLRRLQTSGATI